MPVTENIPLEEQLKQLGFKAVVKEVKMYTKAGSFNFIIPQSKIINGDSLMYQLKFENSEDETKLKKYEVTLQSVKIPKTVIKGINTAKLEKRLVKADKFYNDYYLKDKPVTKEETEIIESMNRDIQQLFDTGGTAKEIASLLMFKFWPEDNYKQYIPDPARLKENYRTEITIQWNNGKILSSDEAYSKAKENFYVPKVTQMNNEHVISDSLFEQAQFELSFNRNWIAYNTINYFLDKGDVYFFEHKDEAMEFSENNISEYDNYKVIHADSIRDLLTQIPYEKQMAKQLQNDPDANGLHNKDGNAFTDALIDHFEGQQSLFNSQVKTNVMNNENFQYLSDNLKYMGFGENLKPELEKNLNEGKAEFQLQYKAEINKKPFEVTMNFRKSDSSDMYFFNNYHASLQKSNGEKMEQTFYLNKGKGVTGKEAFNLLDGRSVHKDLVTKEGHPYKAWIQLDTGAKDKNNNFEVKQFHENYGFDLKGAVEKFAVAELKDPEKEKALMQSLQKGNVQSVTIEKDGSSHKMFIEADPQYKKVNLYDSNMKLVAKESLEQYKAGVDKGSKAIKEDVGDDKKKDLKQEAKPEKEKLEKKNGQSLLPKKRESKGKGLGVS
ncbi:MAG: hypothetical protein IPM10_10670 [Chitinophagaceae bacterium]|nr:hypothetical protein [Chitinophagaceae bacterium]